PRVELILRVTAVLQFLWSFWIEQCGVYFHPSDENLSPGAPDRKTPLDRIGSPIGVERNRCGQVAFSDPGPPATDFRRWGGSKRHIARSKDSTGIGEPP